MADEGKRQANKRGSARLAAVQALYQMDIGQTSLEETLAEFEALRLGRELEGEQYLPADADYFKHIVRGVVQNQLKLDPIIDRTLQGGWPMTRIDATLRALLRAGVFELTMRKDIPFKVVIREYVDVALAFYEDEVPGMVNGVLDSVARQHSEGYGAQE
ncbi:transcription antitermination factor NusB [Pelagibacterium xiamenense]|uniref:transcription antitermination factor NusB n=1 Tax=Pelagibacterium xiamenense TaxID=2901140 RepID=UPI001E4E4CCC|nr:transcription antitermination factor NusB [Pelagibacterium xiamenense]MCD7060792.1 transcription antitermination factor NusB [Pelagibacterium xiamenense]